MAQIIVPNPISRESPPHMSAPPNMTIIHSLYRFCLNAVIIVRFPKSTLKAILPAQLVEDIKSAEPCVICGIMEFADMFRDTSTQHPNGTKRICGVCCDKYKFKWIPYVFVIRRPTCRKKSGEYSFDYNDMYRSCKRCLMADVYPPNEFVDGVN
jgi:hypothetical protein